MLKHVTDNNKSNMDSSLKILEKELKDISKKLDILIEKSETSKKKQLLTSTPCVVNAIYE